MSCPSDTARWDFTIDLASSPAEHCLACWTRQPHTNLAVRTESDHYSVFPASLTRLLHFSLARVRRARACTLPPPLQLPTAARKCSAHAGSSNTHHTMYSDASERARAATVAWHILCLCKFHHLKNFDITELISVYRINQMQGWGLTELQYQSSSCFMILELCLEPSYFFSRIYNCN